MHLIHKVELDFFEDNNGILGLAHKNSYDRDEAFDAFYDGALIFHDVFEHWFEHNHKYFMGNYGFNVAGESAAMGAACYYIQELGLYNRLMYRGFQGIDQILSNTTTDIISEAIWAGYCNFGTELRCCIPKIKYTDNYTLETYLTEYRHQLKQKMRVGSRSEYCCEGEYEFAKKYKKSVTKRKVKSLTRWGYQMAEKLIPHNRNNIEVLINFIEYWNNFTKINLCENMMTMFKGITFRLYKHDDNIHWTGRHISNCYTRNDVVLNENKTNWCLMEYREKNNI